MKMERNTTHSFIHSTTARRTAMYTAGIQVRSAAHTVHHTTILHYNTPQLNIESGHYGDET